MLLLCCFPTAAERGVLESSVHGTPSVERCLSFTVEGSTERQGEKQANGGPCGFGTVCTQVASVGRANWWELCVPSAGEVRICRGNFPYGAEEDTRILRDRTLAHNTNTRVAHVADKRALTQHEVQAQRACECPHCTRARFTQLTLCDNLALTMALAKGRSPSARLNTACR